MKRKTIHFVGLFTLPLRLTDLSTSTSFLLFMLNAPSRVVNRKHCLLDKLLPSSACPKEICSYAFLPSVFLDLPIPSPWCSPSSYLIPLCIPDLKFHWSSFAGFWLKFLGHDPAGGKTFLPPALLGRSPQIQCRGTRRHEGSATLHHHLSNQSLLPQSSKNQLMFLSVLNSRLPQANVKRCISWSIRGERYNVRKG